MSRVFMRVAGLFCMLAFIAPCHAQELPDIRTVPADLIVPELAPGEPRAGRRVKATLAAWQGTAVYHVLQLPENWQSNGEPLPVLVEWAGNGGYENQWGDTCSGRPEGCKLGYGLSAGRDYIWLCLPYVNAAGDQLALKWWGDAPDYDPQPTLAYAGAAVEAICRDFNGDSKRVVWCGFSRGAIAANYLGLYDDAIAKLWCGFFAYSHYDGVRRWPFRDSDREAAAERLARLQGRPQFICMEGDGAQATRDYLTSLASTLGEPLGNFTFASTGFRNHNDAWILRPSPARTAARKWIEELTNTASKSVKRKAP